MRNGIIVPAIQNVWNKFQEKWSTSFIVSVKNKLGVFLSRSLQNSILVSTITDYKTEMYSESLVNKLIESFLGILRKMLNFSNKLFSKSIKESAIFNASYYVCNTIKGNLLQFLCVALGTGILTYTVLSFITGRVGILRVTVFVFASFVLGLLGFINIDVKALLSESRFAAIVRNFFDYYS